MKTLEFLGSEALTDESASLFTVKFTLSDFIFLHQVLIQPMNDKLPKLDLPGQLFAVIGLWKGIFYKLTFT